MSRVTRSYCVYRILGVSTVLSVSAEIFCTIHFGLVVTLASTVQFVSYGAKVRAQPSPPTSVRVQPIRSRGCWQHHLPALCAIIATTNWLPVRNKTVWLSAPALTVLVSLPVMWRLTAVVTFYQQPLCVQDSQGVHWLVCQCQDILYNTLWSSGHAGWHCPICVLWDKGLSPAQSTHLCCARTFAP